MDIKGVASMKDAVAEFKIGDTCFPEPHAFSMNLETITKNQQRTPANYQLQADYIGHCPNCTWTYKIIGADVMDALQRELVDAVVERGSIFTNITTVNDKDGQVYTFKGYIGTDFSASAYHLGRTRVTAGSISFEGGQRYYKDVTISLIGASIKYNKGYSLEV